MTEDDRQPTEAELRAAYEAEIKQIRIEQILLENIVTLVNMGMRKTGLIPGTEDERDPIQVRLAIEGVRAHLGLVDEVAPDQAKSIRDALSQLQMAFVQIGGAGGSAVGSAASGPGVAGSGPASAPEPTRPEPTEPIRPGEPGPAQKSGRLWIPGQ
ncbi:hypothetical protein [Conexibacter sp. DBS9H8]|uniref:hypothetical protein n=1 Tax=Conexibacter sp. DBS9H8 TaxID=2937801 RepID=UPI00200F591E|nr:hypothetical protein [Conexibacter sp. DBS9H8]